MTTKQLDDEDDVNQRSAAGQNQTQVSPHGLSSPPRADPSAPFGLFALSPGLRLPPCDADLSYSNFRNGWDRAFNPQPAVNLAAEINKQATTYTVSGIQATKLNAAGFCQHDNGYGSQPYPCALCEASAMQAELIEKQQALLAERERCAKIAETWGDWCGRDGYDAEEYASRDIAAKIRSGA